MATVSQIEKKIAKLQRELKEARKVERAKDKVRRAKRRAEPMTLDECKKVYTRRLSYFAGKRRRWETGREYSFRMKKRERIKESRVLYVEICEHLLEGRAVRITTKSGKSRRYSSLRRTGVGTHYEGLTVTQTSSHLNWVGTLLHPTKMRTSVTLRTILNVLTDNAWPWQGGYMNQTREDLTIEFL